MSITYVRVPLTCKRDANNTLTIIEKEHSFPNPNNTLLPVTVFFSFQTLPA